MSEDKTTSDLITVVIPAWDDYAGPLLAEAVESVRAQDIAAAVIIVDNASAPPIAPMDGVQILRTDSRLSVGAARNLGLAEVDTPYVVFLDADDLLLEGALRAMLGLARSHPAAVAWVLGIVDGVTGRRHRSSRRISRLLARRPRLFAVANAAWSLLPTQGATLLRTDVIRQLGGYDDSQRGGDDWPLCAALAFKGRIVFSPVPGLLYRWRPSSPGGDAFTSRQVRDNARRVRARLRQDSSTPAWLPMFLPVVQLSAVLIVRPAIRRMRQLRSTPRPQGCDEPPGGRSAS